MSLRMTALLLASVLWYLAAANTHETADCCLTTSTKKVPHRVVRTYIIQTSDGGCRIPATVLITWRRIRLCVPPAAGNNWVAKLLRKVARRRPRKGKSRPSKKRA
ncbi:C-C motif chemokine 19b [Myripristis murdjan]|uniref:C-C motif chemokine 19b n=1 Tax=Myripristis murdjan TaxID=586833 RepID=UPI001175DAF5|nr:C-C motif chemokine 19 [Myripristis murdjan]